MTTNTRTLIACALLAVPALLWAQSREEIYNGAKKSEAAADKKLNAAYQNLINDIRTHNDKELADSLVERLRKSQQAWSEFRDAQLDFVSHYHALGYSYMRAAKIAGYNTELIEARTKDLTNVPDPN